MTSAVHEKAAFAVLSLCLCFTVLGLAGCSQTAPPITTPAAGKVDTYFGGPFGVVGSSVGRSSSSFDHSAGQIGVSAFLNNGQLLVPTQVLSGSFATADTGFLAVTENFLTTSSGIITPQNPPMSGAWAVEIPGAGALANLLSVNSIS